MSAILLVAMFVTHSGGEYSQLLIFHKSIGPAIGLLLLCRVCYRFLHGLPETQKKKGFSPDRLAIKLFLIATVLLVLSGYCLPWSQGAPLHLAGLQIAPPVFISPIYYGSIKTLHYVAGYSLVPLMLVHILLTTAPERMFTVKPKGH